MEEKFNDIYNETYHTITRYVISKCDNLSNVEEIVQDGYLKLYKLIYKNYDILDYNSFLIKLSKNELFKYYKIKNKVKVTFNKDIDNDIDIADENVNIEDDFNRKYDLGLIWKAIKKQDLITQKIITLYYLENMKIKDISILLNKNENTIKSLLYRGIKKIKNDYKIIAALVCTLIVILGFGFYYNNPTSYVSLDINPSVLLGVNSFDKVVKIEALNEDASKVTNNLKLYNTDVTDAVNKVVNEAKNLGYVETEDAILVTTYCDNTEKKVREQQKNQLLFRNMSIILIFVFGLFCI